MVFSLPKSTFFGRVLPKTKIIEQLQAKKYSNISLRKQELSEKIQKIIWKHKISPTTTRIPVGGNIPEIQIFEIELKEKIIPKNLIQLLDKIIPYPILYRFVYENNFCYGISLKYSQVEMVKKDYYFSDWNEEIVFDFSAISIEVLYQNICKNFLVYKQNSQKLPDNIMATEKFVNIVKDQALLDSLRKEINFLEQRYQKEKQISYKHQLHKEILHKQQQLQGLLRKNK